jgi:hypothetical protein
MSYTEHILRREIGIFKAASAARAGSHCNDARPIIKRWSRARGRELTVGAMRAVDGAFEIA